MFVPLFFKNVVGGGGIVSDGTLYGPNCLFNVPTECCFQVADPKRVAVGQSYDCFQQLMNNPHDVFMDVSELLIKFATNIINNPGNPKYKSIRVGNKIFQSRLLPVSGGVECLFVMGFEEVGASCSHSFMSSPHVLNS